MGQAIGTGSMTSPELPMGHLKRVTRLLKYLRDHKVTFAVKSILLTTLVGNTVYGESDGSNFDSVPNALKTVSNRLDDFLQANPNMPAIDNPVLPGESFTRHWTQDNYSNFRKLFHTYRQKIDAAHSATEHDESVDLWRDIFGPKFGRKRGNGNGGKSATSAARRSAVSVSPKRPWSA